MIKHCGMSVTDQALEGLMLRLAILGAFGVATILLARKHRRSSKLVHGIHALTRETLLIGNFLR